MGVHLIWFAVILSLGLASATAIQVSEMLSRRSRSSVLTPIIVAGGIAVVYVLLGLLWSLQAPAELDGEVVVLLSQDRKEVTGSIFAILTTFGDSIPMMTIGAAIAVVLYRRTGAWQVWLLPAVIMCEQILQVGTFNALPALTIGDVAPEVVDGTAGSYPSGSVARMLSLFGVAALLCDHLGIRGAWTFRAVGAVLLIEQAVSRLYLGRHLMMDIVGGLLLGLILIAGMAVVLKLSTTSKAPAPQPDASTARVRA